MEQRLFTLKPSPVVMIAVVAVILALVGVGAWNRASPLLLGGIGLSALALALVAIAVRRRA
jgi:hypothetical protein